MLPNEDSIYIKDADIINTNENIKITIGASFKSDIFYQYHNIIPPQLGILYFESHDLFYQAIPNVNNMTGTICINDEIMDIGSRCKMLYGDKLSIKGLNIRYYGKILIITASYGDMRVARRN